MLQNNCTNIETSTVSYKLLVFFSVESTSIVYSMHGLFIMMQYVS